VLNACPFVYVPLPVGVTERIWNDVKSLFVWSQNKLFLPVSDCLFVLFLSAALPGWGV